MKYIGIDGCRLGWIYVGLNDDGSFSVGVIREIEAISAWIDAAKLILIDIPIGLPSAGVPHRMCDVAAREMISPRGSTIFSAPARSAIACRSYEEGSAENYRCLGKRLSKQSWFITAKIKDVDDFIRANGAVGKIREMHPEVAFCGLNGGVPLLTKKKSSEGYDERLCMLERYYPAARKVVAAARADTPLKKHLQDDDILDALVGAVTARQHPNIQTLPKQPLVDDEGLPMEIVFATAMEQS